jgi:hypothetical protein
VCHRLKIQQLIYQDGFPNFFIHAILFYEEWKEDIAYFNESSNGPGSLYTVESECPGEKGPDVFDYSRGNQDAIGSD